MEYKETAEYAFDLMEHEYIMVDALIHSLGADNFNVYVPNKLKSNLEVKTPKGEITYPAKYHGMKIVFAPVVKPLFVLKGNNI